MFAALSRKAVLRVLLAMRCYSEGMALYVRLMVYMGLSLFIIRRAYVYLVVCVLYAYNLTVDEFITFHEFDEKVTSTY